MMVSNFPIYLIEILDDFVNITLLVGVMHSFALDFKDVPGSHNGERIANQVIYVIKKYHLEGKVIGIVVDNAKVNDVAIKKISQALNLDEDTFPTDKEIHFRCFAHILNICCQGKI
jgi:hypothetical protein